MWLISFLGWWKEQINELKKVFRLFSLGLMITRRNRVRSCWMLIEESHQFKATPFPNWDFFQYSFPSLGGKVQPFQIIHHPTPKGPNSFQVFFWICSPTHQNGQHTHFCDFRGSPNPNLVPKTKKKPLICKPKETEDTRHRNLYKTRGSSEERIVSSRLEQILLHKTQTLILANTTQGPG